MAVTISSGRRWIAHSMTACETARHEHAHRWTESNGISHQHAFAYSYTRAVDTGPRTHTGTPHIARVSACLASCPWGHARSSRSVHASAVLRAWRRVLTLITDELLCTLELYVAESDRSLESGGKPLFVLFTPLGKSSLRAFICTIVHPPRWSMTRAIDRVR